MEPLNPTPAVALYNSLFFPPLQKYPLAGTPERIALAKIEAALAVAAERDHLALAAHTALAVSEERERIAQAIEATREAHRARHGTQAPRPSRALQATLNAFTRSARVARGEP